MIHFLQGNACFFLAALFLSLAPTGFLQKAPKEAKRVPRTVWNLEGGAFFVTDGHLPGGQCFRLFGQANAPGFFDNLKRIDSEENTSFLRGEKVVIEYPDQLDVQITIRDSPCSIALTDTSPRPPLTRELMSTLALKMYWKSGVALRPAGRPHNPRLVIKLIEPYVNTTSTDLPQRYEWTYTFAVHTAGVPLTESLVFTIETQEGRIAARTAARL